MAICLIATIFSTHAINGHAFYKLKLRKLQRNSVNGFKKLYSYETILATIACKLCTVNFQAMKHSLLVVGHTV